MKSINIWLLMFIVVLSHSSCEDQDGTEVDVQFLDASFFGSCFSGVYDKGYEEVIIMDNKTYQDFGDSIRVQFVNTDCSKVVLPEIDFSESFLIGKFTQGGGCSVRYDRKVTIDKDTKTLVYKIKADYSGNCYILFINMNWALVPKSYKDYTIEFQVD